MEIFLLPFLGIFFTTAEEKGEKFSLNLWQDHRGSESEFSFFFSHRW